MLQVQAYRVDYSSFTALSDACPCLLQIKFHILSHQKLSRSSQDSDASSLCYLNMEQLMKCLLSLFDMYDVIHKNNSQSSKETEYYSFYVLLHLGCKIPKMVCPQFLLPSK